MNDFVSVKKLKKEPFLPSCDISYAQHCAMDVVLEEVLKLSDLNLFVLGVGECAFYSQKQSFGEKRRNWAYQLTDREIVFGDLQGVENAVNDISANGLKTVCVVTCIPCIMNLELESITENRDDVIIVNAPNFKGISAYDILGELYYQLLKDVTVDADKGVAVWEKDFNSVEAIVKHLQAKTHIVKNKKYGKLLEHLSKNFPLEIIDDTHFQSVEVYRSRGQNEETLAKINAIVAKLKGKKLNVKSAKAYEFALFLQNHGCEIGAVVFSVYNEDAYNRCMQLGENVRVCLDYRTELPADGAVNIDLSKFDEEIFQMHGAERLLKMLEKTEELCQL